MTEQRSLQSACTVEHDPRAEVPEKVFVAGPGALGLFLASSFAHAGNAVSLLARLGTPLTSIAPVVLAPETAPSAGAEPVIPLHHWDAVSAAEWESSLVFVAVKARDLHSVLAQIRNLSAARGSLPGAVLVLTNGIGITSALRAWKQTLPHGGASLAIARGTAWFGCRRESRERVRFSGPARLDWAWLDENHDSRMPGVLSRSLSPWGIPWVQEESAERLEWRKGAWNASMNPLLALADRRNGALLEDRDLAREFEALLDEAFAVAAAEGFPLSTSDRELIWNGVRGSRTNWNSMHGDLHGGRPTELSFLNEELVTRGRAHGIPVPAHEQLVFAIRSFEAQRLREESSSAAKKTVENLRRAE